MTLLRLLKGFLIIIILIFLFIQIFIHRPLVQSIKSDQQKPLTLSSEENYIIQKWLK
ncbi:hypothetical protein [Gottfriedia solisilvae]|uniref:Uncharacterized protein n=1 Tax=Gottfriedia solisilvae TaxID=1516104 RepID=A0A8J3EWV5_9BACI|nr:hypothetical protein [Gottfriedia solisilvae]GGI10964.1 hypothetical protein GCM10007380_05450 [Gottfriedia solisilvae]